jgi:hypothetical protein
MTVVPLDAEPRPMTEEQKFIFDIKGWLLLPGVLDPAFLAEVRTYLIDVKNRNEQTPAKDRVRAVWPGSLSGPAQSLVDHPAIVGILREIIGPDVGGAYGFRCESSFVINRPCGYAGFQEPHCGPEVGPLQYSISHGRISAGLVRVVWELSAVTNGGTAIMSGSHKRTFPVPESCRQYSPELYESYSCPAGSVVIFTESCWHYGVEWRDRSQNRVALFNCYNSYLAQWHRMCLPPDLIESMPPLRRTAFRGVWGHDFGRRQENSYYSRENQAF